MSYQRFRFRGDGYEDDDAGEGEGEGEDYYQPADHNTDGVRRDVIPMGRGIFHGTVDAHQRANPHTFNYTIQPGYDQYTTPTRGSTNYHYQQPGDRVDPSYINLPQDSARPSAGRTYLRVPQALAATNFSSSTLTPSFLPGQPTFTPTTNFSTSTLAPSFLPGQPTFTTTTNFSPLTLAPSILPAQSMFASVQSQDYAGRVELYLKDGRGHHRRVTNDKDYKQLTAAYLSRNNNLRINENEDSDYPTDQIKKEDHVRDLHEAMEDLTCIGPNPDRGLKIAADRILGTDSFAFNLLAYALFKKIRAADLGVDMIPGYAKITKPSKKTVEQYPTFKARFKIVKDNLRTNKLLVVRLLNIDFAQRLAYNPLAEVKATKDNEKVNSSKKDKFEELKVLKGLKARDQLTDDDSAQDDATADEAGDEASPSRAQTTTKRAAHGSSQYGPKKRPRLTQSKAQPQDVSDAGVAGD